MVFKLEDVKDIAKDKKATQSSLCKHSFYDDASRACKSDLKVEDFAFHTAYEQSPWWLLDLESEELIDCIRITSSVSENLKQALVKKIKVELSADKMNWVLLDGSMFEWHNEFEFLDINVYQIFKTRYIKISLQGGGHLAFKKCEVFVRKVPAIIIAARSDGLGGRLITLMFASYIAQKTKYPFRMYYLPDAAPWWKDSPTAMPSAKELFSAQYLKKYVIDKVDFQDRYVPDVYGCTIEEGYKLPPFRKWGWFISANHYPSEWMKGIDKDESLLECKKIYESVEFSEKAEQILNDVKNIYEDLGEDFVGVHIRTGDIVFMLYTITEAYVGKSLPYEIAIEIIRQKMNAHNIIIFGDDFDTNEELVQYIQTLNPKKKILNAQDFAIKYELKWRAFFEINLLARASQIYASKGSMFSKAAAMIAGKDTIINLYQLFSTEELYNIMKSNITCLKSSPLQKSYAWYRTYIYARELKLSDEVLCGYLQKAISFNKKNYAYKIALIRHLFQMHQLSEVENILQQCIDTNCELFFESLFLKISWLDGYVKETTEVFLNCDEKQNYAYISFVCAKIALYRKDKEKALEYLEFALKLRPYNENFLILSNLLHKDKSMILLGAKERVQNHLAYKLGTALIKNSKNLKDYFRLLFILQDVKTNHMAEQKAYQALIKQKPELKLPRIETYPDYNEALKVKEHLSYKLGEALIRADKIWYLGGYVKFYFEAKRLYKEYKKAKNKI